MRGSLRAVTEAKESRATFLVPEMGLTYITAGTREPESGTFGRLLRILEAHEAAEADSLSTYRELAGQGDDPVVALLLQMLIADEDRHHDLLRRMAATIRDGVYWTRSPEALPGPARNVGGGREKLAAAVRELAQQERESARHFGRLARENRDLSDGLFALLLDTMARDSEKHERILRFVLRRLEGR
jgi:rubrerythrin